LPLAAVATSSHGYWDSGCRNDWASRSSSRIGLVLAEQSAGNLEIRMELGLE
jgi:hypothetical protein